MRNKAQKPQEWSLLDGSACLQISGKAVIVDADQLSRVLLVRWCVDSRGYVRGRFDGNPVRLHRYIVQPTGNQVVDHINGNRLDNRKKNLRICSHAENMQNQRKACGKSIYKGVTIAAGRARARIQSDGDIFRLGSFDTEIEAALAYDRAAKIYHGEYACTNKSLGLL